MIVPLAFTTVTGVAEYVASELEDTFGGRPDRIVHLAPGQIAWDSCDCGQLAQTITGVTSSKVGTAPADDSPAFGCGHPLRIVSVTMSLVRCVPGIPFDVDRQDPVPEAAALMNAALILEDDRTTLRRSIFQHLKSLYDAYTIRDFTVGAASSVGPEGQCGGVEINYTVTLDNDVIC